MSSPAVRPLAPSETFGVKAVQDPSLRRGDRPAAGQRWALWLPFTLPLSMNDRRHWAQRARDVREWRNAACLLARGKRIPLCERISVGLVYAPKDARKRDAPNLLASMKPAVDGLVDAGIVVDDDDAHVVCLMPEILPAGAPAGIGGSRFRLSIERLA